MINSVLIKNFQSHKESKLIFHKGVNVIIGRTDAGKTSVIRALIWSVLNKPSGDAFRSDWGGDTEVTLKLNTGEIVSRIKTNSKNIYMLNDTVFSAFGNDIPEEIIKAVNMSYINIQQQFDKFFLIQNTPGEIARHFNKIVHLDVIDKSLSFLNKGINSLNSDMKKDKSRKKELIEKLNSYDYLDEFETELDELEAEESSLKLKKEQSVKLSKLLMVIEKNENKEFDLLEKLKIETSLNKILNLFEQKLEKSAKYNSIHTLISSIKLKNKDIKYDKNILLAEDSIKELLKLHENRKIKQQKQDKIKKLINILSIGIKHVKHIEKDFKIKEQKFRDEFPDICPLCNTKLS